MRSNELRSNEPDTGRGPALRAGLVVALLIVGGCNSARIDGPAATPYAAGAAAAAEFEPLDEPIAASPVISSPLPPAPGTDVAPLGAPSSEVATLGPPSGVQTLGAPAAAPAPVVATRSSATGSWKAREASGGSCKMTLSSTPSLDLYKAASSGCANKDLQSVNAWEFRDGEVYLYARGGVVARLRDGGGAFNGALAKSGAPLTLTR